MFQTAYTNLGGRQHLQVSVTGDSSGSIAEQSKRAMDKALALIAEAGYAHAGVVRSRIFARDANARRIASDLRVDMLKGDLRAASSSYIDPSRFPDGSNVAVDLIAVRIPSGLKKLTREYEPPIAPPMFVSVDGVIYVSGCTDVSDSFQAQLTNVRTYIARNLEAAGAKWQDVIAVSAHVSRKIDPDEAWNRLSGLFPSLQGPMSMSPVDGYSAPEKLIEIEATARAS